MENLRRQDPQEAELVVQVVTNDPSFCPLQTSSRIPNAMQSGPVHRVSGRPRAATRSWVTAAGWWGANQAMGILIRPIWVQIGDFHFSQHQCHPLCYATLKGFNPTNTNKQVMTPTLQLLTSDCRQNLASKA